MDLQKCELCGSLFIGSDLIQRCYHCSVRGTVYANERDRAEYERNIDAAYRARAEREAEEARKWRA